ncbi:MAG TPA: DUF2231 domain-containing protein, partial [Longimicrobium sp.]|nr:DUF2231 domain-containing protein [Longimicrobium sp.]
MSVPAHLWLAHFPVALLLVGAAADAAGAALRDPRVRRFATVLLVLGAALAVAAFLAGQGALFRVQGRLAPGDPRLDAHTQWGGAGVWALAA